MSVRSVSLALSAVALVAAVAFAADAGKSASSGGAHPFFKDQGALSWSEKLADAQTAAKSSDKLIFIEYGRKACTNCQALCETVLPAATIKERLGKLCVGLAADCDKPESDVEKLIHENLKGASTLPFVGFITTDLKWVAGCAGYQTVEQFDAVLAQAEKSPLLEAKPDVAKKLDGLAAQAAKGAEKLDWKSVFTASKSASEMKGRSPAREKIAAAITQGRTWAETELAKGAESVKAAGDRAAVRATLSKIVSAFAGEPEAKDADNGSKALAKLGVIEGLPAEQQTAAREKAAKDFAGTRWAAWFEKTADAK